MKGKNTWEIPGGHIEHGENWRTAAERELYEKALGKKGSGMLFCVGSLYLAGELKAYLAKRNG